MIINLPNNSLVQSPYLLLQGAGSTGDNDIPEGIHLRWALRDYLGAHHLPKGNYAGTNNNFNKPNDFVNLYRAPYNEKFQATIDLANDAPDNVIDNAKLWVFLNVNFEGLVVYLWFRNENQYDTVRNSINPYYSPLEFVKAYGNNLLEVEVKDDLFFAAEMGVVSTGSNPVLRAEALSVNEASPLSDRVVTCRRKYNQGFPDPGENLLTNPGFEDGDEGFETDYEYRENIGDYGVYFIKNEAPSTWNSTPHSGNLHMVIDGEPTQPDKAFWRQEITNLKPNTFYEFAGWLFNNSADMPSYEIEIKFTDGNGDSEVQTVMMPADLGWQRFSLEWNSGNSTSVTIEMINNNLIGIGNDFAIDDLFFGELTSIQETLVCSTEHLEPENEDGGGNGGCGEGNNLIDNPGFEGGNEGFATDFNYSEYFAQGDYYVTSDAENLGSEAGDFIGTPHSGELFMAVHNSQEQEEMVIWQQEMEVSDHQRYCLCGQMANLKEGTTPEIKLRITGLGGDGYVEEKTVKVPAKTGRWAPFFLSYFTNDNDGIRVEILDINTEEDTAIGLDDLYFGQCNKQPASETDGCGQEKNLISNPNFEQGNQGFEVDDQLEFDNDFEYPGKYYTPQEADELANGEFAGEPVAGERFLAVYPHWEGYNTVWSNTYKVGTAFDYCFCGFLANLSDNVYLPGIIVRVWGLDDGGNRDEMIAERKFKASDNPGEWQQFFLRFSTNGYDNIEIDVVDVLGQNRGPFGLDKLYFGMCDEVGTDQQGTYQTVCAARMVSENINSIRLKTEDAHFSKIKIETYRDFIKGKNGQDDWAEVGNFALTTDTSTAENRLEDTSRFNVHNTWPKYNDGAKVNINNYQDRWNKTDGIQTGVTEYINLSDTDAKAKKTLSGTHDDDGDIEVSYLDMLNLVSYDYHIARMLGLGHIDLTSEEDAGVYIYASEYISEGNLNDGQGVRTVNHVYATYPISKALERTPLKPALSSLEYGIYDQNGNRDEALTDANGYIEGKDAARYISLFLEQFQHSGELTPFFNPSDEFCITHFSTNVFLGIEYKKQGESNWRKPEISHDENYDDTDGVPETQPIPNNGDENRPIFIHRETEEGVHLYAPYGIDWFARPSGVGQELTTDTTNLPQPNTLLPPHNFHVQLIQEENPLVLTSQDEQNMLTSPWTPLVRVTFDYHHVHDLAYQFGDEIEVYFREDLPRKVQGGVKSVEDDPNDHKKSIVRTQDYHYNSNNETVSPTITSSNNNYIGGVMVINKQRYVIDDVNNSSVSGEGPIFTIFKEEESLVTKPEEGNSTQTDTNFVAPDSTDANGAPAKFTAIENVANQGNWPANAFQDPIQIDTSQWTTKDESYIYNGRIVEHKVRGIWENADINELSGNYPRQTDGVYEITFKNFTLKNHSQTAGNALHSIDWYRGVVRIPIANGNNDPNYNDPKKVLKVIKIINFGDSVTSNTKLHAVDETHSEQPIKTGNDIEVNFYPGYRAYYKADNDAGFTETSIMPTGNDHYEDSLMGALSKDADPNKNHYSSIGKPAILRAQKMIEPEKPLAPSAESKYATRPDYYNKSTYTFKVNFQHEPFAAVFYRANERAILDALYKPQKVASIQSELESINDEGYKNALWQYLLGFSYGNDFRDFNGYTFPKPNNDSVNDKFNDSNKFSEIESEVKAEILSVFTPLTPKPLIYEFINGPNHQPKPDKQKIRDKNGNLLAPHDMELSPMAKKTGNGNEVQFTDFTLDGAAENLYFYGVREMGNQNSLGEFSPVIGPIQLINTDPPKKPDIKQVTTQLADPVNNEPPKINFKVNNYSSIENVKKVTIYRTNNALDANNVRNMSKVKTVDLEAEGLLGQSVFSIQDDFPNVSYPPFGENLFYRLVALREIENENGNPEYVPSQPSDLLLTNVVDNTNPPAPEITAIHGSSNTPPQLTGVSFQWPKTAHNATYYLYKMNEKGNWNKIDQMSTNDNLITVDLEATSWDSAQLDKEDDAGNTIYHRFKVEVENASGLLNLEDKELTL